MFKQYYRPPALGCLIYVAIYFCASCSKEPHTATASAAQVQASIAAIDKLIDAGQFENALRVARAPLGVAKGEPDAVALGAALRDAAWAVAEAEGAPAGGAKSAHRYASADARERASVAV